MKINSITGRPILREAIPRAPRNFAAYAGILIKKFNSVPGRLAPIKKVFDEIENRIDDRDDYTWFASDLNRKFQKFYEIDYLASHFERIFRLEEFVRDLESTLKWGYQFLTYYVQRFEWVDEDVNRNVPEALEALRHLDEVYADMAENGSLDDEAAGDLPERTFKALRNFQKLLIDVQGWLEDSRAKFTELQRIRAHNYRPEDFRPIHGSLETLYHATAYAAEIVKSGFSAEKPDAWIGLGNYGTQNGISFTHDLYIAKVIMRGLKEFCLIGRGELTARHILDWAKHEGVDTSNADPVIDHRNHPERPWTMADAANLYRWHAYMTGLKMRSNPMFTYPVEVAKSLANRDPRDIGVLECEVDLSNYHSFHFSESEFRVPPEAVRSIKRIM